VHFHSFQIAHNARFHDVHNARFHDVHTPKQTAVELVQSFNFDATLICINLFPACMRHLYQFVPSLYETFVSICSQLTLICINLFPACMRHFYCILYLIPIARPVYMWTWGFMASSIPLPH